MRHVSKSSFKAKASKHFADVEKSGVPLVITDGGKPVLKLVPFVDRSRDLLSELRGSVLEYVDPTEPVMPSEWEASD